MPNIAETMCTRMTEQLDRVEETLPEFPARIFRLQRAVARRAYDTTQSVVDAVSGSVRDFVGTARTSGRTVVGQARSASEQVAGTTRAAANTVAGQTTAQGRRVGRKASTEATKLLDDAVDAVEDAVEDAEKAVDTTPGSGRRYEDWTKAELMERARELGVEGRTGLNKRQLIAALRKAA